MARIALVMELSSIDFSRSSGGLDTACQSHLSGILKYGATEHTYLVIAFTHFDDVPEDHVTEVVRENLTVVRHNFHLKSASLMRFLPNFLIRERAVKDAIKAFKPDVIHTHIPTLPLGRYGAQTKILTLHSWKKIAREGQGVFNDFLYESVLQPLALFSANKVTTVSRDIEDLLKKWHAGSGRELKYVPNPVSEKFVLTPRRKNCAGSPVILVSGAIVPRKRVIECTDVFKKATELIPGARLRFAGKYDVDSLYFSAVKQHIRHLGIEKQVDFLGALNSDDLISEIDACWCALSMSSDETFGLAPLEAMVRYKPVVVTRVGVFKFDYDKMTQAGASVVEVDDVLAASIVLAKYIESPVQIDGFTKLNDLYSGEAQVRVFERMYVGA